MTWMAVRHTLLVVLALNALVTVIKLIVGARTGALTVIGAGLESTLDLINNIIALSLVRIAHLEPDEEHPYGHGKFETLGTLAVVGFLSISCFELLRQGTLALWHATPVNAATLGDIGFVISTLVINAFVVAYEARKGRELNSQLLLADAAHTRSTRGATSWSRCWLSSRSGCRAMGCRVWTAHWQSSSR